MKIETKKRESIRIEVVPETGDSVVMVLLSSTFLEHNIAKEKARLMELKPEFAELWATKRTYELASEFLASKIDDLHSQLHKPTNIETINRRIAELEAQKSALEG